MPKSHTLGLLMLRVSFGLVIAAHGAHHLASFHAFEAMAGSPLKAWGAIAGELGGGLGLAFGLLTRLAGLGYGAVMLAIAFTRNVPQGVVHALLAIGKPTPVELTFEYAMLTGILGLAFVFTGAGEWSLDGKLFGKKGGGGR